MLKLIFSLLVSVTVARWIYSEIALIFPPAIPAIDYTIEKISIPTHDQWSNEGVQEFFSQWNGKAQKYAKEIKQKAPFEGNLELSDKASELVRF